MVFRSLAVRAVVALALLVGFYAIGLAVGLGLIGGGLWIVTQLRHIPVKVVLLMFASGGIVLWSLVPRRVKFEPPGPRLDPAAHPALFQEIESIARQMGQAMPAEVYAFGEVNAFVTQRGGIFGLGSRRVMGIGLGLLAADNVSQFRATVAHEFGHYAGGDTGLGPLIYATRAAMARTVTNLHGSVLQGPFLWMGNQFLRLTQVISRQQELIADEWSVRLAGKSAHVTGLRQEAIHGAAFGVFFQNEVRPLVAQGVAPDNLFAGYRQYAKSSAWAAIQDRLHEAVRAHKSDPFDSHPALEERIAYAEGLALGDLPMDERPATVLLGADIESLESQLTGVALPAGLRRVSWSESAAHFGAEVIEAGRRWQGRNPSVDTGTSIAALFDGDAARPLLEQSDPIHVQAVLTADELAGAVRFRVGGYVSALLVDAGFAWTTAPGETLALTRGGVRVVVPDVLAAAQRGETARADLETRLWSLGLAPDRKLDVPEDARARIAARRADVELSPKGKRTRALVTFGPLAWPRRCPVCLAPATETMQLQYPVNDGKVRVTLRVGTCASHEQAALEALHPVSYDESVDRLTIDLDNAAYAELLEKVNA